MDQPSTLQRSRTRPPERVQIHRNLLQSRAHSPNPRLLVTQPIRSRSRPGPSGVNQSPAGVHQSWAFAEPKDRPPRAISALALTVLVTAMLPVAYGLSIGPANVVANHFPA